VLLGKALPKEKLEPASGKPWCGPRPVSVDGVPIIGPTPIPSLSVNTGHGHLGWTMAAGSGQLLADLVTHAAPAIDPVPYDVKRFA
jgi:D-amino-acid dehydrogenase